MKIVPTLIVILILVKLEMAKIFVDTSFWIAQSNPQDQWHKAAKKATQELDESPKLVTTDMVLTEFLAGLSMNFKKKGDNSSKQRKRQLEDRRERLVKIVRRIMEKPDITVIEQTRQIFLDALELYEKRLGTGYSLTDCSSMVIMRNQSINDILTSDYHFQQEGFTILIKK